MSALVKVEGAVRETGNAIVRYKGTVYSNVIIDSADGETVSIPRAVAGSRVPNAFVAGTKATWWILRHPMAGREVVAFLENGRFSYVNLLPRVIKIAILMPILTLIIAFNLAAMKVPVPILLLVPLVPVWAIYNVIAAYRSVQSLKRAFARDGGTRVLRPRAI